MAPPYGVRGHYSKERQGEKIIKPKSKVAGIMVSDFIDEHNGFLMLNDKEYEQAKATQPGIRKYAREFLEYCENKEGYWISDKFITTDENSCHHCRNQIYKNSWLEACVGF